MVIINRPHTDPYFNLAAEEYLLRKFDNDVFMLWQNEPSIIIGKHQNTF
ncbi:MAG: lipoate--protein ligase, partial [Bacteroidetes bacterium 4484_249]